MLARQAQAAQPLAAAPAPARVCERRRIMLVDDNVDAAQTLAALLEAAGHAVQTVNDPRAALAAAATQAPDVFILDIGMPDIDGHALARQLRAQPALSGATYVALTGYGQASDRASSHDAGFDHHLVKPVDAEQLLAVLDRRDEQTVR